jgi:hypothetical protein
MLVTSNFKKDDVITFRLSTGEEVVAKLVEEKDDCYVVNKPLAMVMQQEGPAMGPMMFSADWQEHNVQIYKTGVVMTAVTIIEVKKAYLQSTSSIDLSAAPSIIS